MTRVKWLGVVALTAIVALCSLLLAADTTLYRKASPYTTIVVTEGEGGLRTLRFGDDARQSVVKVGDPDHVELQYAQAMPIALAVVEESRRVLVVGLGGGTIPSLLRKHYPRMAIDVVDIDPDVVKVAKEFFGFREDAAMRVHVDDGRHYIETCKVPYDIIFLDAYGADNIPYDLATKEFLQAVRRAVGPRGVVAANVWSSRSNPLYDAMVRTYQEVFDDLYVVDVKDSGNKILLALPRREQIGQDDLMHRASQISKDKHLRFDLGEHVASGFHHLDAKDTHARVLLDKDKPSSTDH